MMTIKQIKAHGSVCYWCQVTMLAIENFRGEMGEDFDLLRPFFDAAIAANNALQEANLKPWA